MSLFRLGLTGSIGMGKSTTAALFAAEGIPVWDADAAVHRLYAQGGAAVPSLAALCPEAQLRGAINRAALKAWIAGDPSALAQIEAIVHPLVAADRAAFATNIVSDIAVFDIPLLFEKGTEADMHATLLVTAPPDLQRARVLQRPGMTEAQFALVLQRQMPDAEKRARATHIVETLDEASVRAYVKALLNHIRSKNA
jgi:dephospho-CoA kinase